MGGFFETTGPIETMFLACAVLGGALFLVRVILQFVAMGHGDGDIDHGPPVEGHGVESDLSFKLLTFQGITAFFLMFGLVGLALLRQAGLQAGWSILGGTAAGLLTMWLIQKMFQGMSKLQSSGTIDLNNAVGQEGTVYLTIPAGGTGQAQITVQERHKICEAIVKSKAEIKTGERVRVVEVVNGTTLVVEKL